MSFDLGVWFTPAGMTPAEAEARYDRLLDQESAAPAGYRHPQVAAVRRELTARHPQLVGDELDASPWSSEFTTTNDAMVVSISGRPSRTVAPFVRELADRHGLVVYADLVTAFTGFLLDDPTWKQPFDWSKVEL